jgi:hypothetical protein
VRSCGITSSVAVLLLSLNMTCGSARSLLDVRADVVEGMRSGWGYIVFRRPISGSVELHIYLAPDIFKVKGLAILLHWPRGPDVARAACGGDMALPWDEGAAAGRRAFS